VSLVELQAYIYDATFKASVLHDSLQYSPSNITSYYRVQGKVMQYLTINKFMSLYAHNNDKTVA